MSADIVALLDGVKVTGPDRYMARCPAHEDRSPSLSIRQCDDGRVLLHCFAGCDVETVCDSLGIGLADLMPERLPDHRYKPVRRRMPASDALVALEHSAMVVAIVGADMLEYREIDESTWSELAQAVARINTVRTECYR